MLIAIIHYLSQLPQCDLQAADCQTKLCKCYFRRSRDFKVLKGRRPLNIGVRGGGGVRFCSLIFLIFSFHPSLALCIKTHSKTQEKALMRLCLSKFSGGAFPGIFMFAPPKFLSPYAYAPEHKIF